ncbi:MAG: ABC transporter substrate-binding protein, partial [Spirochaetales bacterium]|nr:ABC transporter substrate-binding protein [Spirochaetales bacterium]
MTKKLTILLLLIMSGFILFANGKAEDNSVIEENASEWEIPFMNCLTGSIASIGEYLQWGAEYAAKEINEQGGIAGKPVKIIRVDTGLSPEKGTVEMSKLVKDSLVVMGPVPENVIMASMPIAVDEGVYCFTATTSYEYAAEYFPWAISWFTPTEKQLPYIVKAWAEKTKVKRVVQFVEHQAAWPGMAKAHAVGLEKAGCTVLEDIEVPEDAVSFGPLIVKALSENPDGIIFACNAEKVPKIIIELKNRGWENMENLLVFSSADDAALYTAGGDKINGVMIYNYNDPALDTER